jgi:hypothetical protein
MTNPLISLLASLWWLWAIALLVALLRIPAIKGWAGEQLVRLSLRLSLPAKDYQVRHDLTLPCSDGTTQIDHLVVSRFGVFVVETKNLRGWIFGGEHQPTWTQKIYRQSYKFQNPLRQNHKHVEVIRELTGLTPDTLFSVIVFVGGSEFKTPMPANVTYGLGLVRFIKFRQEVVLSSARTAELLRLIDTAAMERGRDTHRKHVAQLKVRFERPIVDTTACPKCGGPMKRRTSRRGEHSGQAFLGCASYPKCRGTRTL